MASSSPLTVTGSAATIRAYATDWADFATWCQMIGLAPLPAAPATVAGYVAEMADPPDDRSAAAVSTITRRLAAIGQVHSLAHHDNPSTDPLVREAMRGIRRALGVAPRHQKKGNHHRRHQGRGGPTRARVE